MKFNLLLSIVALATGIVAAPTTANDPVAAPALEVSHQIMHCMISLTNPQRRGVSNCRAPGAHKCAVIVWASLGSLGIKGSTTGGRGVNVVGGNCDNIIASGGVHPDNPGFSADITTTYGPHLYFGANTIGLRNIGGVRYQYLGRSYQQSDCFNTGGTSGTFAVDAIQCNFDC